MLQFCTGIEIPRIMMFEMYLGVNIWSCLCWVAVVIFGCCCPVCVLDKWAVGSLEKSTSVGQRVTQLNIDRLGGKTERAE